MKYFSTQEITSIKNYIDSNRTTITNNDDEINEGQYLWIISQTSHIRADMLEKISNEYFYNENRNEYSWANKFLDSMKQFLDVLVDEGIIPRGTTIGDPLFLNQMIHERSDIMRAQEVISVLNQCITPKILKLATILYMAKNNVNVPISAMDRAFVELLGEKLEDLNIDDMLLVEHQNDDSSSPSINARMAEINNALVAQNQDVEISPSELILENERLRLLWGRQNDDNIAPSANARMAETNDELAEHNQNVEVSVRELISENEHLRFQINEAYKEAYKQWCTIFKTQDETFLVEQQNDDSSSPSANARMAETNDELAEHNQNVEVSVRELISENEHLRFQINEAYKEAYKQWCTIFKTQDETFLVEQQNDEVSVRELSSMALISQIQLLGDEYMA